MANIFNFPVPEALHPNSVSERSVAGIEGYDSSSACYSEGSWTVNQVEKQPGRRLTHSRI